MANENKHRSVNNRYSKLIHIHLSFFLHFSFTRIIWPRPFSTKINVTWSAQQLFQLMHFYWDFIDFLIVRRGCGLSFFLLLLLLSLLCASTFFLLFLANCRNYLDGVCVYNVHICRFRFFFVLRYNWAELTAQLNWFIQTCIQTHRRNTFIHFVCLHFVAILQRTINANTCVRKN